MQDEIRLIEADLTRRLGVGVVGHYQAERHRVVLRAGLAGYEISGHVIRDMVERVGGWDAYGLFGMDASPMQIAMRLDGARPERIPPAVGELRLSHAGLEFCRMIADELRPMVAAHASA